MSEIAKSVNANGIAGGNDAALESRIFRAMIATVVLAAIASATLMPWQVTAGLILGGVLSLLNYHWLRTSIAVVLSSSTTGTHPRFGISRYIVRYLVIAVVVFAAYTLQLVSLAATIVGLCSFVPALFFEAGRQFYFAITHREESF